MSRLLGRAFAGRTGLSEPVLVLQAGSAVNCFGDGLIVPFEIVYLHRARGFPGATAGFVLAAIMGAAALETPSSGALADRFRAKPILIAGSLASGLGYAGLAFVDRPSGKRSSARSSAAPGSESRTPGTEFWASPWSCFAPRQGP